MMRGLTAAADSIATALRLYDEERHQNHGQIFMGHDPGVFCHPVGATVKQAPGHVEDASAHANGALALSRRIDHVPSLIHCPTMLGHWQIKTDDHQGVLESSEELETIAQSHHLGAVGINAQVLRGWARAPGRAGTRAGRA